MRSFFLVFSLSPPSLFSAVFSIVEQVLLILYLILMYHLTFFFPVLCMQIQRSFFCHLLYQFQWFSFLCLKC